tara:strand:+ start:889 stop:1452 length:564 start_codon:yes stop_codon:yes gene_type:complete
MAIKHIHFSLLLIILIFLMNNKLFASEEKNKIAMITNLGKIVIKLNYKKAPLTVKNFLHYAKSGHYNGTIFHRVIDNFMIQGGGYNIEMVEKKTIEPIKNEAKNGLKNKIYTIAMARTPNPHSATSQFFINVNNNYFLDYPGQDGWGYAVFGEVIEGKDVINKIKSVKTNRSDKPLSPIIIENVSTI